MRAALLVLVLLCACGDDSTSAARGVDRCLSADGRAVAIEHQLANAEQLHWFTVAVAAGDPQASKPRIRIEPDTYNLIPRGDDWYGYHAVYIVTVEFLGLDPWTYTKYAAAVINVKNCVMTLARD